MTTVYASEWQLQVAPYYDSNVSEQIMPRRSGGIRMRVNFDESVQTQHIRLDGSLMAHGYADAVFTRESKIIVTPSISATTEVWPNTMLFGGVSHFEKRYYHQSESVRWTEFNAMARREFSPDLSGWLTVTSRLTAVRFGPLYRYTNTELQTGGRFLVNRNFNAEVMLSVFQLIHKDFLAWDLSAGSELVQLENHQKDYGSRLSAHLQYRSNLIAGIQTSVEKVQSNSLIGDYSLITVRGYLTGHIGESTFYHIVLQYTQKNYRNTVQSIPRGYLDPERPAQNRAYFRLERVFGDDIIGYGQVSSLQNETVRVNRYYDKVLIEMGVIYEW